MIRRSRARATAQVALERRYRRLLGWYPAAYRAANEDEMLGVALSRARRISAGRAWARRSTWLHREHGCGSAQLSPASIVLAAG